VAESVGEAGGEEVVLIGWEVVSRRTARHSCRVRAELERTERRKGSVIRSATVIFTEELEAEGEKEVCGQWLEKIWKFKVEAAENMPEARASKVRRLKE
jgi:hypothetical protein